MCWPVLLLLIASTDWIGVYGDRFTYHRNDSAPPPGYDEFSHRDDQRLKLSPAASIIVPKVPVCMRDKFDRMPANLGKVVEDPKKYIRGPTSEMKGAKQEVVIVGAGISGLTSAYLLASVGHKVTLLEGSDRYGGRIYTQYGNGYYGDMGAMRFPQYHILLQKMLKVFNVKTAPFTNYNEGSQGNYLFLNNKYILAKHLEKQNVLRDLYRSYGLNESSIPKDESGKVRNPKDVIWEILDGEVQKAKHCEGDTTLGEFLREKCKEKGIDPRVIQIWATIVASLPYLGYSEDGFLSDSDENLLHFSALKLPYLEIVNGSSQFPMAVFNRLKEMPDFTYLDKSPVFRVDNRKKENKITRVYYGEKGVNENFIDADLVIIAVTAGAVSMMEFVDPLPNWKSLALSQLNYFTSTKIFMKFKSPFWARTEGNKAKPILYGNYPNKRAGGTGITNNKLNQVYYPSYPYHGPSLLATYTWEHDANFWAGFNQSQAFDLVLDELSQIHGPVVRDEFEDGMMKKWGEDRWSHGAFVLQTVAQKYEFQESLSKACKNLLFVGEYTFKYYNGWTEAAVNSAVRTIVNMSPEKYEEEFLAEDLTFLARPDREI